LPIPDREGYSDTFEDGRSVFEFQAGAVRRRNKYRKSPILVGVQWSLTQTEYTVFDTWHQFTIAGGALEFDIQLLDDDDELVWYTVRGIGQFTYEILDPQGPLCYCVKWQLRLMEESFGTDRPSGTDDLRGSASVGITTSGAILVYTPIRGRAIIDVTAVNRFAPVLFGRTTVGLTPRARFEPRPTYGKAQITVVPVATFTPPVINYYPELSRQWQNLDWLSDGLSSGDISGNSIVVRREWLGL
jgi:hypothetical protein